MLNVNLNEEESIVILEPNGALCEKDFHCAAKIIDPFIKKNGKLDGVIIHVDTFPGWESFSALISHLKFVKNHHKKISHVAIVTNSMIGKFAQAVMSHFVSAEVKTFTYYELENAKIWIKTPLQNIKRHGITFGIERVENNFFLRFNILGTLTHKDYEKITPMLDSALETVEDPKIKALIDISQFEGWELRAAWDDFKIGLKYGSDFEKIAIVGTTQWLEYGIEISSWFLSAEIKHFDTQEEAIEWLKD